VFGICLTIAFRRICNHNDGRQPTIIAIPRQPSSHYQSHFVFNQTDGMIEYPAMMTNQYINDGEKRHSGRLL